MAQFVNWQTAMTKDGAFAQRPCIVKIQKAAPLETALPKVQEWTAREKRRAVVGALHVVRDIEVKEQGVLVPQG